jgi:hypothetical protein
MIQHRIASHPRHSALRHVRALLSASVLGSALVMSIATSPAEYPQLAAASAIEPIVIAEGEETVERSVTVTIDEGALAIEGNATTATLMLCALTASGEQHESCYHYTDDNDALPAGVIAELFIDDATEATDDETLRLGGSIGSLEAALFEAGETEQKLTIRFTRVVPPEGEPGGVEGEIRFEALISVTTRFDSLDENEWDQIEGLELGLEGDLAPAIDEDLGDEALGDEAAEGEEELAEDSGDEADA